MTHQRLASFVFLALFASACGGGSGSSSNPYDPNAPPKIADQPAVITNAQPPDSTQQPVGSSTPTTSAPGGGNSCEAVCGRLVTQNCSLGTANSCADACQQIHAQPCADQLLALLDCAQKLGYCPDDAEQADSQQIAASCSTQTVAYANCAAANDK